MRQRHVLSGVSILVLLTSTLAAQSTWTGAASNSWDNPFNWSTGLVPTATTDVVIAAAPNQPSSFIFDPSCKSLTIGPSASLDLVAGFDLSIGGNLVIQGGGSLSVFSSTSDLALAGGWTNDGAFAHGGGTVEMTGTGVLAGSTPSTFQDLALTGGVRTASVDFTVMGDVSVGSGATLDLGATAHVKGNWSSAAAGAATIGAGTVRFEGTGLLTTGLNGLPNLEITSGVRSVNPSTVTGNVAMSGGTLQVLDNATLIVGGDATLSAGTLSFQSLFVGNEILDVAGDADVTCAAGGFSDAVRILCAGSWTSNASFHPTAGSVELDGVGTRTLSGSGLSLFNLRIQSGTVNALSTATIGGSLVVDSNAVLNASAVLSIADAVVLGGGAGAWSLGGLEHAVGGDWTSSGMPATGGTIRFTGAGDILTGGAAIENVIVDGGPRGTGDLYIPGELRVLSGAFTLSDGSGTLVGGDAHLDGGSLAFEETSTAAEVLDVNGSVFAMGTTAGPIGETAQIHCAGDWTSNDTFVPGDGTVRFDGGSTATIGGTAVRFHRVRIIDGAKTFAVPATLSGDFAVDSGATVTTSAPFAVAGFVSLGGPTTTWDLGGLAVTIGGDLTAGGAALINGSLLFDGVGGAIDLGGGSAPVMTIGSGAWTIGSLGASDLFIAGGDVSLDPGGLLSVAGTLVATGGVLSLGAGATLAAGADVEFSGVSAGLVDATSRIEFGAAWTAAPSWAPTTGATAYVGGPLGAIHGNAGFFDLSVESGVLTSDGPVAIAGDLTLAGALQSLAPVTVAGAVGLDVTGAWDQGGITHVVSGNWVSLGGSATNGTVEFDAGGDVLLGGGTLDAMAVSAGVRLVTTGAIQGDLSVTGGTLRIDQDQTFTVQGDATLSGGKIGWFPSAGGPDEALIVEGDASCDAAVEFEGAGSRFVCRGSWTSGPAFAPNAAAVVLDGLAPTTIGGAPDLFFLVCSNATRTLVSPLHVRGNLLVQSGAAVDAAGGKLDVDGDATLSAGTGLVLGALTHTVGGDLLASGATVTGTGTLELDGDGSLETGVGTALPNARVSAGLRTAKTSVIGGTLEMTGGTLSIANDQVLTVNGLAKLTGGTLSFADSGGGFETLDAAAVELTAAAGAMNANSLILCSGDWTSSSAWAPSAGTVLLDGGGTGTVGGPSPTFHDLAVLDGDKTVATATQIAGGLSVFGTESLTTQAPVTVLGSVTLLPTATWNTGQITHVVHGGWESTGAFVNNSGFLEFDGDGALSTGASTIPNVSVVAGTRSVSTSTIRFNLGLSGGTLVIGDNQTLTVHQDALFSAGTLAFEGTTPGAETLVIEGDVLDLSAASGATSASALIVARGDWSSSSAWAPASGTVRLEPATIAVVSGSTPTFADMEVASGSAVVTVPAEVAGALRVDSGAVLSTQASLTASGGVVLGDATAAWDVGTSAHDVSGNWTSAGGSAAGAGEIRFTGAGSIVCAGGTLPDVRVVSGIRGAIDADVDGDLVLEGGALRIEDDGLAHVSGAFTMTGGVLAFLAGSPGVETLDVDGDVQIQGGSASGATAQSEIRCGGSFTAVASFAPSAGTVILDGAGPATVGGAGLDLPRLSVSAGTHTLIDAATLDALEIASGASLIAQQALDVTGPVALGDATATLDLGGLTHEVGGDWSTAGASATNGTIQFDGTGTLDTGAASISNVRITQGTRTVRTSAITGDFELNAGTLVVDDDATLSIGGLGTFLGGAIAWPAVADGTPDVIDVEGAAICRSAVQSDSVDALLSSAGDWSSNSNFLMSAGTVALDGAGATDLAGLPVGENPSFARLVISNGTRNVVGDIALAADVIRIESGSELALDGSHAEYAGGLLTVDGTLAVGAGGRFDLGSGVVALVGPSGTLRLQGAFGDPAILGGASGGGYLLSIDGTLDAANFRVENPGPGGVVVAQSATIASLESGAFASPSPSPGSLLLDIRRATPTSLFYVDFEDPGAVGTFNARTLGGAAITFVDSQGDFSGPAFESDPLGLIAWTSMPTVVTAFEGTPGADAVQLEWSTSSEVHVAAWVLQRATSPSGPFADVYQVAASGPSAYAYVDTSVVAAQTYTYRLQEQKTHGERVDHGTLSATPWSAALPANVLAVGVSGAYPDVQSALAAITGANPVLRLEAGTYPAFTVGAGLGALRIFADGSGPVVIDTSLAPVVIQNLGASDSVEISDLEIGSFGSPNEAVSIVSCAGLVVLDELVVHGGAAQAGVHVTASTRVAVQRCAVDGDPGLRADAASTVIVGRGSLDEIDAAGGSNARLAQVAPSVTVDGTSAVTTLPGVHANFDVPEFASLGGTLDVAYDGEPGGIYVTAFSTSLAWFDLPAPFEMVGLLNLAQVPQLTSGVLGATPTLQTLPLPPDGSLFGAAIPVQMVVVHPTTLQFRWSNVSSIVLID